MSDLYEFRMYLFDNGDTEECLFFVLNFKMMIEASGSMDTGAKVQHLRTLVHGEALSQFDFLYADMEGTEPLIVEYIIKAL